MYAWAQFIFGFGIGGETALCVLHASCSDMHHAVTCMHAGPGHPEPSGLRCGASAAAGEYPLSSTRATEETEGARVASQRHRGRKVMLAYTMQARAAPVLWPHSTAVMLLCGTCAGSAVGPCSCVR